MKSLHRISDWNGIRESAFPGIGLANPIHRSGPESVNPDMIHL